MAKISLRNIQFIAYHGFYPEENICGGRFEVDMSVEFHLVNQMNDDLVKTINYETLYAIAEKQMRVIYSLIETPAINMLKEIVDTWPLVKDCQVTIRKLSPVIPGKAQYSEIMLTKIDIENCESQHPLNSE